jgi:hypothetical protein
MSDDKEILVPQAKKHLENLKLEVANETLGRELQQDISADNYEQALDAKKHAVTEDLGLQAKVDEVGWENMTTREVGQIGGRVGGQIGGQMVKELIAKAESQMAPVDDTVVDDAKASLQSTKDG